MGACIGEVIAGKNLGKKALLFGAVAQSVPDIDFVSSFWFDPAENLLAHRGFSHSFLFALMITGLLSLISARCYRQQRVPFKIWILLWGINILVHLFIDSLNAYGTGWFEPFSHKRISFHILFVADPVFTIGPLTAFIALLFLNKRVEKRKVWCRIGIGLSALYVFCAAINKIIIDSNVKQILTQQSIQYQKYLTTPTPLNSLLWYIAVRDSTGFYIGYRSIFDTEKNIDFQYFPQKDTLLVSVHDHESLHHLRRFSQGYYTVEKWRDTLVFNDLRFGQVIGWHDSKEKFVFHYFLHHPSENNLVLQRGRFAKWNKESVLSLLNRIKGN